MTEAAMTFDTQDIVVEEVFPHTPETIWRTLTSGELIGRWLLTKPTGFEPVKGARFTFQTTPAGGLVTSAAGLPSLTYSRTIRDDQNQL
jgi:uncharacterized protein YndB with AHSA1/START domain